VLQPLLDLGIDLGEGGDGNAVRDSILLLISAGHHEALGCFQAAEGQSQIETGGGGRPDLGGQTLTSVPSLVASSRIFS
jgi:hypothetical protein